jgi:hypothetical protein
MAGGACFASLPEKKIFDLFYVMTLKRSNQRVLKGTGLMKNLFVVTLLIFLFIIPGCHRSSRESPSELKAPQKSHVSSPPESQSTQAKAPQNDRIIVHGGLNKKKRDKLREVAKTKCLDLHYTVSSEDKNTGNLICVRLTDGGQNVITTNFDKRGFSVSVKGDMSGMPIVDSITEKELSDHKKQMQDALKKAAGIKK